MQSSLERGGRRGAGLSSSHSVSMRAPIAITGNAVLNSSSNQMPVQPTGTVTYWRFFLSLTKDGNYVGFTYYQYLAHYRLLSLTSACFADESCTY